MKSRRRIAFPEAQDHADDVRLQQGVAADEMGVGGQFARQQPDEISRKRRQSVIGAFCPPKSDYNVLSLDKSLYRLLRKPTTGITVCWACAASGHAAVEPAIALMKSRRRTAAPASLRLLRGSTFSRSSSVT